MLILKRRTDNLWAPDNSSYTGYGVDVFDANQNTPLAEIPDISLSDSDVAEFISLCNASDVSYTHLFELIEDFFL